MFLYIVYTLVLSNKFSSPASLCLSGLETWNIYIFLKEILQMGQNLVFCSKEISAE